MVRGLYATLVSLYLISQPPSWQMRLLALAPWVVTLIAGTGATKPESVEEAGV